MADRFDYSIAGFADALPYSGPKTKVPTTIARYVHSARRLADWARARGLQGYEELTARDLRAFLSSLHGRDGGPATEGHKATVWWGIRALFRYLEAEEDVRDVARRISVPQPPQSDRICHLEPADVERLLKACRDPREEAVISVCLDAGLRISELASLTVADVAVDDIRARHLVVRGKGGKVRGTVIGAATATVLRRYLRERARSRHAALPGLWLGQQGAMTISGLNKLIRAVGARAGLDGIHPHLLRHTWAHYYRLNGGQTDNLVYLAGWSGPAMALRYGRSAAAERAEQEALGLSLVDRQRRRR
jgi:site-specific recombinase XerD